MEKIPTAREFYDKHDSDDCVVMMIDFAKLHVEAALKEAVKCLPYDDKMNQSLLDKKSILNSYPVENIK